MKTVFQMYNGANGNGHVNGIHTKSVLEPTKELYLPPPPEEILIVDQDHPVTIPPLASFDLLTKIVEQAVRVWPVCHERGHLTVNELKSIFYDLNNQPKKLWYSKVL